MTRLEEIRDRAEAATKGPWNVDDEEQTVRARTYAGEIMFDRSAYGRAVWGREDRADAEFIAHARTDIPRLLAALDAITTLHQPYPDDAKWPGEPGECAGCRNGEDMCCGEHPWPCETLAAITTALEGTE